MRKTAYLEIDENMTAKIASDKLMAAAKAGCDRVIVYHSKNADITRAKYKEQLLMVFRGAYRHKVALYITDDKYSFSGTAFGQLCSVKNLSQRVLTIKNKSDAEDGEIIVAEKNGRCVVARFAPTNPAYPYGRLPDLTNPACAPLVIESVYKPLIGEYKKFLGYEFKGFLCDNPIMFGDGVLYSESAVEKYGKDRLFDMLEENDCEEYNRLLKKCVKQNFLKPLETFCKENNLDFVYGVNENGLSDIYFGDGSMTKINTPFDALNVCANGFEPLVRADGCIEKIKNIGRIFEEYPECKMVEFDRLENTWSDSIVITNTTRDTVKLGFLFDGEWCVYDWEKDELYDWNPKAVITLGKNGFLCLVKKAHGMYTDKLPFAAAQVLTADYSVGESVDFEKRDDKYAFYLPDCNLSDSALLLDGNGGEIKAKIGAMEHEIYSLPYVIPLYDFQREAGCLIESGVGEIEKIVVLKKTEEN